MGANKREFRLRVLSQILPYLESQGFKRWKPGHRDEAPTVYLERYRRGKRELLDIQFDKYGRFAFYVNLASVNGDSVETMFEGVMPASRVTSAHLREGCRLSPGSQAFKPSLMNRLRGPIKAAEQVVASFTRLFAEADEWLERGKISPHIQTYRL